MNQKGKNILPMIGFILIVGVLLGGFAMARALKGDNLSVRKATQGNEQKNGLHSNYTLDETGEVSTKGMNKISISAVSSEINILSHQSDTVEAHFYGNLKTVNKDFLPYLEVKKEGDTAVVKVKYPQALNISTLGSSKLDVTIPEGWKDDLEVSSVSGKIGAVELTGEDIRLNTTSGSIEVDTLSGKDVRLNSTSGDFKINQLIAKESFDKTTVSGRCEIDTVDCEEADLNSTSGGTFIKMSNSDKVKAQSISGRIEIKMKKGSADFQTTSGGIYATFTDSFEKFKANSISGTVKLEIPENSDFKIDVNTVSGDIRCNDFAVKISSSKRNKLEGEVGDGESRIDVDTTSGSVEISKE